MGESDKAGDRNTVRVVVEKYLAFIQTRRAVNTLKIRTHHLNLFLGFQEIASCMVRDLKHQHVYDYLASMEGKRTYTIFGMNTRETSWSSSTPKIAVDSIMAAFSWAKKSGLTNTNPITGIEKGKTKSRSRDFIISPEFHNLIMTKIGKHLRPVVSILYHTGARPSEIAAATAAHFQPDDEALLFPQEETAHLGEHRHKTAKNKDRIIFLAGESLALVQDAVKQHPTGPLFLTKFGQPWTTGKIGIQFHKLKKKLRQPKLTAYCYRHTFATQFIQAGGSVDLLTELMGNTAEVIRRHYSHLLTEKLVLRDCLRKFLASRNGNQ